MFVAETAVSFDFVSSLPQGLGTHHGNDSPHPQGTAGACHNVGGTRGGNAANGRLVRSQQDALAAPHSGSPRKEERSMEK